MQDSAIRVASQSQLPIFEVGLRDLWGNAAGPCEGLECTLTVASKALSPPLSSFTFSDAGIAFVTGVAVGCNAESSIIHTECTARILFLKSYCTSFH